jgi:hypothetical protein
VASGHDERTVYQLVRTCCSLPGPDFSQSNVPGGFDVMS